MTRTIAAYRIGSNGIETVWKMPQTTTEWATLIGPKDHRVWVGTEIPGAEIPGANQTDTVVWRDAATGRLLARSRWVPAMTQPSAIQPGYGGSVFFPGLEGTPVQAHAAPRAVITVNVRRGLVACLAAGSILGPATADARTPSVRKVESLARQAYIWGLAPEFVYRFEKYNNLATAPRNRLGGGSGVAAAWNNNATNAGDASVLYLNSMLDLSGRKARGRTKELVLTVPPSKTNYLVVTCSTRSSTRSGASARGRPRRRARRRT